MRLKKHYEELYNASIIKIENGNYKTDSLIDLPNDNRFGITLLIRPPENIKDNIQFFIEELKQIDNAQYYYPNTDIHITVMSIISCYDGFKLEQISVSDYKKLIYQSIREHNKFKIEFQGITASDSSIMLQGFPENETLHNIREKLRLNFKESDLEQSIDKRYTIQTAHSTIVRFRNKIQNKKKFIKVVQKFKNQDFGSFEVKELELVFNDWYQRKKYTKPLEKFKL